MGRTFYLIFQYIWILLAPIMFGAVISVGLGLYLFGESGWIALIWIVYAIIWLWINEDYVTKHKYSL